MGVLSEGNVRVSLPPGADEEDVDRFLSVLPGVVSGVREKLGAPAAVSKVPASVDALVVDALGRRCPIPVIELAMVMGQVPVGGTGRVLSDDVAARLDIPAWGQMRGQEYVGAERADRGSAYLVRPLL